MRNHADLTQAKKNKSDEFYTQLSDIEAEMQYYTRHFKGKSVLCNCDDPYGSDFFRYFIENFDALGLRKLTAVSYAGSLVASTGVPQQSCHGYKFEVMRETCGTHFGLAEVEKALLRKDRSVLHRLHGDGDFRSGEGVQLLKEADIVVTNPPFSLFNDFVSLIDHYNKGFLVLGTVMKLTSQPIYDMVMRNRIQLGVSITCGDREFRVPKQYPLDASSCRTESDGTRYIRVTSVRWFTNLDHGVRRPFIQLQKEFKPELYPRYVNYDGINVDRVALIPKDYTGVVGVPITFMDKYNSNQFELIQFAKGVDGKYLRYLHNGDNVKPACRILVRNIAA